VDPGALLTFANRPPFFLFFPYCICSKTGATMTVSRPAGSLGEGGGGRGLVGKWIAVLGDGTYDVFCWSTISCTEVLNGARFASSSI
jgi:hypothetical protein